MRNFGKALKGHDCFQILSKIIQSFNLDRSQDTHNGISKLRNVHKMIFKICHNNFFQIWIVLYDCCLIQKDTHHPMHHCGNT